MDTELLNAGWTKYVVGAARPILLLILKTLLDFNVDRVLVKYVSFMPSRGALRARYYDLRGEWEHVWDSGGSTGFSEERHRHDYPTIKQWGNYCYAEQISRGKKYYFFGRIMGERVVGEWADLRDRAGNFGTFQLRIVNSDTLEGIWIGHSKTSLAIRSDNSTWTRIKK